MIKTLRNLLKQDKERFVVPRGVQDVIPIKAIYDDGIFQVGRDKFSKTYKFSDINYAVASREAKEANGLVLCDARKAHCGSGGIAGQHRCYPAQARRNREADE